MSSITAVSHRFSQMQFQPGSFRQFLESDARENLKLFELSYHQAMDVLKEAAQCNPNITSFGVGPDFFLKFINWEAIFHSYRLETLCILIDLFPEDFRRVAHEVIIDFLERDIQQERNTFHDKHREAFTKIAEAFAQAGATSDPFYRLWLQIAQGSKPNDLFKREFDLLSADQQHKLYEVAFIYANPYVYQPADQPVPPDHYSLNFMWINRSKMPPDERFLFGNEQEFTSKFIEPISKWAMANVGSSTNVWIDRELATAEAIDRSEAALQDALEGKPHAAVRFRDIRSIPVVSSFPNSLLFDEKVPMFLRIDLVRAAVADHLVRTEEVQFPVSLDLDIEPLSGDELFNQRTVTDLDKTGIAMAKGGPHGFENSFQILNGKHLQMVDSHRKVIIDLTIEFALEQPQAIREQEVYDRYPAMITHFLLQRGEHGGLIIDGENPFRRDQFTMVGRRVLPLEVPIKLVDALPRKPVMAPLSNQLIYILKANAYV